MTAERTSHPTPTVGAPVYGADRQPIGHVERFDDDDLHVDGRHLPWNEVARVDAQGVYLRQAAAFYSVDRFGIHDAAGAMQVVDQPGEIRIPEVEERVSVRKEKTQIGEVRVQTHVAEEQRTVPVQVGHEEVFVERRTTPERPLGPGEAAALHEQTIRVPVEAETVNLAREAMVTGEVVVHKEERIEPQPVSATVRRAWVDVDEAYNKARPAFEQHFTHWINTGMPNAAGTASAKQVRPVSTFEEAEPYYRAGFDAGRRPEYAEKRLEEIEPELRQHYGRTDRWEHLRGVVAEGFRRGRTLLHPR